MVVLVFVAWEEKAFASVLVVVVPVEVVVVPVVVLVPVVMNCWSWMTRMMKMKMIVCLQLVSGSSLRLVQHQGSSLSVVEVDLAAVPAMKMMTVVMPQAS